MISTNTILTIVVVLVVLVLLIIVIFILYWFCYRGKQRNRKISDTGKGVFDLKACLDYSCLFVCFKGGMGTGACPCTPFALQMCL